MISFAPIFKMDESVVNNLRNPEPGHQAGAEQVPPETDGGLPVMGDPGQVVDSGIHGHAD